MDIEFDLEELFGFLTGKASTAIGRRLQRNLKQAGLEVTQEQFAVLFALWQKDLQSQQELATATFKDKPSITRLIDGLERAGLAARMNHPSDRRSNLVYLTDKGKTLKSKALKMAYQTIEEALAGLSAVEIETCKHVLNQVFSNLLHEETKVDKEKN
jgi:DNA-binding MarR family transcriptional regulator